MLGLGWRAVFLLNVPVGVAALVAAGRIVPESRSATARRLDALGIAVVGTVFFAALGGHSGLGAYGAAVAVAMALQAALALVSAALVTRARERAPAMVPAREAA